MPWYGLMAVEGDYTTWTIQAIYDTNLPYDVGHDFVGIRNDGRVIFHDNTTHTTYIISPAGALLATLTDEYSLFAYGLRYHSLTDRYILFIDEGFDDIVVQEGIGETWRRMVDLDKGAYTLDANPLATPGGISISQSGEWIVAIVKEATTGNGLIFIYKGS